MTGIFKVNEISTIGGTTPQGKGIEIVGHIGDWTVVTVEDSAISGVQEFNIQPIDDNYLKGITGPQAEGAYNAAAYGVTSFGDKMRFENNPDQIIVGIPGIPDGTKIVSADEKDTESQKNFTAEDVTLANVSNAIIIGFNVRPQPIAKDMADKENVEIKTYSVIYNAIEDVEAAMKGMLDPVFKEVVIGNAEVRQTFKIFDILYRCSKLKCFLFFPGVTP